VISHCSKPSLWRCRSLPEATLHGQAAARIGMSARVNLYEEETPLIAARTSAPSPRQDVPEPSHRRPFGVTFECFPRRILVMALIGLLWTVWSSATADAKGGVPLTSYVVVTGPGLSHPWVLHATGTRPKGYRGGASELFVNLATRLGVLGEGAAAKPMATPDPGELRARYDVYFFLSCCQATVREVLYPFALQGAVAYLPPGQERVFARMFGRPFLFSGWFLVFEGNVIRDQMLALGATPYVASSPVEPNASRPQPGTSNRSIALMAVGLLVLAGGVFAGRYARRRSIAT